LTGRFTINSDYDEGRTDHLAGYGYRVLRFRNDEVLSDLDGVLARIAEALATPRS
jgi:very-short-patch-repair endonuclease